MKKTFEEFKEFIAQGNVMDMAVGVIIGSAFGKIVTALVDNILMPIVGIFLGGVDFSNLSITIEDSVIAYGAFIQAVIDFLIIAVCIFIMMKALAKLKLMTIERNKQEEEKAEEEQVEQEDEQTKLLRDILATLKQANGDDQPKIHPHKE